jgi:DNA-binding beta-propeller fold protein YncE
MKNTPRLLLSALILTLLGVIAGCAAPAQPFTPLKLSQVRGLALDRAGNLYVPDIPTSTLYRITPSGEASIVPTAPIMNPHAVAVAPDDTIYVVETEVNKVHRLDANGATSLVPPDREDVFLGATSIVFDPAGNMYIGENDVNIVRKRTPAGEFSIYAGAFKVRGDDDGASADARFVRPRGLAIDRVGNIFVADEASHIIRKITPGGQVSTLAGTAGESGTQDGRGRAARFNAPRGLATDAAGNVYVMDTNNGAIRKITPDGTVTTFAGRTGEVGFADGPAAAARFNGPRAGVFDPAGNLFVADEDNGAVRMISPSGVVRTIAGVLPKS